MLTENEKKIQKIAERIAWTLAYIVGVAFAIFLVVAMFGFCVWMLQDIISIWTGAC